jgi:hypothetical protein
MNISLLSAGKGFGLLRLDPYIRDDVTFLKKPVMVRQVRRFRFLSLTWRFLEDFLLQFVVADTIILTLVPCLVMLTRYSSDLRIKTQVAICFSGRFLGPSQRTLFATKCNRHYLLGCFT